jgi:hypothetical protein
MSSLDLELDTRMNELEFHWRQVYEASMIARAEYQALAADRKANADLLDAARERLERAEASEVRIMAKLERLEDHLLNQD